MTCVDVRGSGCCREGEVNDHLIKKVPESGSFGKNMNLSRSRIGTIYMLIHCYHSSLEPCLAGLTEQWATCRANNIK